MTVIDIGANQGCLSLYAASKGATVYAFEPCVENFEILKRNVVSNGLSDRVKILNVAVTGKQGPVPLYVGLDASGEILSRSVSIVNENRGGNGVGLRSINSVALDSSLNDLQIQKCDFLKMDSEGAEYEILGGTSRSSFQKIASISMECHDNRMDEAIMILRGAGFDIVCQMAGEAGLLKGINTECKVLGKSA